MSLDVKNDKKGIFIMKKHLWTICYSAALFMFTLYIALDTFVISSVYQADASAVNLALFDEQSVDNDRMTEALAVNPAESGEGSSVSEEANSVKTNRVSASRGKTRKTSASQTGPVYEKTSVSEVNLQQVSGSASAGADVSGESLSKQTGTYEDENIKITLKEYSVNGTTVYAADVQLTSARYLRTALANNAYGKNVTDTTSNIAEDNNAVLAINGDYYGAQERGYVIRNGIVYRDTPGKTDVLCIYADGSMGIADPSEVTARELADSGVWQAFSFGPVLVADGAVSIDPSAEVGKAMASNPRTAIGIIDDLHYLFVVADGRTAESEGLSLYELAQFMEQLGAETAYNLDGGGSSTMVFNGELVNMPTTNGRTIKERKVSDIVYVG